MAGWLLRKLLQLLIVVFILAVLGLIYVLMFVDPSNFKAQINDIIQTRTGYKIEVKGPIAWTFKPQFTLTLQDVTLAGPDGFKSNFFVAKEAHILMNLTSLLDDNLVIKKLEINGMIATIERLATGARNIDALPTNKNPSAENLTINDLTISNSTLLFQNEQSHTHWALNNASCNMKSVVFKPFSTFGAVAIKGDFTQLDYNVSFNVDGSVKLDTKKMSASFDPLTITWNGAKFTGKSAITQYNTTPIINGSFAMDPISLEALAVALDPETVTNSSELNGKLQGKFSYTYTDADYVLAIPDFEMQLGDGALKGNLKFNLDAPYLVSFDITVNQLTIEPYFPVVHAMIPIIYKHLGVASPIDLLKTIGISGKISATNIKLTTDFLIDHLTADIGLNKGIAQLGPVIFKAFDGGHNFGLTIDLNQASPDIKVVEQGNNVQLEPWLKLLKLPKMVTGIAEINMALEGNGFNFATVKQSANGAMELHVKNAAVFGLDLDKLNAYAISSISDIMNQTGTNKNADISKLIKTKADSWVNTQKNTQSTPFDTMQIKYDVKDGIAATNATMSSNYYDVNCTGSIKLVDFNLALSAQVTNKIAPTTPLPEIGKSILQNPLTVTVSGTLDNPVYSPDLQNYISKILGQSQDSLMSTAVQKMVKAAGTSTQTNATAEQIFINSLQGLKQ